jgi:ABC-type polysaccharide/polyol phosphate export permease
MIKAMIIREIKTRYAGTFVGFFWSVIQPLAMMLIYWFVFSVGFKMQPMSGAPFVVVFVCGLMPWTVFSESLMGSTNAITNNVHLVKKISFPTEILPIVCLGASLVSHAIMLLILLFLLAFYGITLSVYAFQFVYYLVALWIFTLGLSWLCSSLNAFYRDLGQILGVLLTMWFWLTPVVWSVQLIPEKYHTLLMLNPMFYIVEGYKASFVSQIPFWHNWTLGLYFWAICLSTCLLGVSVFRRLKPEFPEVL